MNPFKILPKALHLLRARLREQGLRTTAWWAADHAVRIVTGAPIERFSRIGPQLHVGGQYRRRGWPRLAARGITAVVNLRIEFDDAAAGIAPPRYLHLPTVDDTPPSTEDLERGAAFVSAEIARGGQVYVHCGSGIGRAATMAAAYLVTAGLTPDQAWAEIRRARPFIRPTPPQLEALRRFENLRKA
jgi:protein tyrosine phosphatase (PTP) superfamily phosphohydrolase (DUF442 family)